MRLIPVYPAGPPTQEQPRRDIQHRYVYLIVNTVYTYTYNTYTYIYIYIYVPNGMIVCAVHTIGIYA